MSENNGLIDWREKIINYHIPRWEELPELELYMDQIVMLINRYLKPLLQEGEKIITASMINNYVKIGVVPPPVRKKYTREQLAYLLVICMSKQVLSIAEIKALIEYQTKNRDLSKAYNYFCAEQEAALKAAVSQVGNYNPSHVNESYELMGSVDIEESRNEENLGLKMAVFAFASKLLSVKIIETYISKKE